MTQNLGASGVTAAALDHLMRPNASMLPRSRSVRFRLSARRASMGVLLRR